MSMLRSTLRRSTNMVRSVGRGSMRTLKRGTNAVGMTKHRKSRRQTRRR